MCRRRLANISLKPPAPSAPPGCCVRRCCARQLGLQAQGAQRATGSSGVIFDEIGGLPVESFGLSLPHDPRILRVAQLLLDSPADARGFEAWAALAGVSERTLGRRFFEETGFSFTNWRQRARLLRSLEMLANGEPVTTIAIDLGYSTASAFIALFKRVFGETPASYRSKLI